MLYSINWYKYSVFFGIRRRIARKTDLSGGPGSCETGPGKPGSKEDLFLLSNSLKEQLEPGIRDAAIKKKEKQELLSLLRSILKKNIALSSMHAYPFRVAINNFIDSKTKKYCSIHLDKEELLSLWHEAG
ncbi:hypothetical protein ACX0G9_05500 [Flavitalea flava]